MCIQQFIFANSEISDKFTLHVKKRDTIMYSNNRNVKNNVTTPAFIFSEILAPRGISFQNA